MRRDHHASAIGADTDVRFHHRNIFDVLGDAGRNTWTHYTLLDAPDWMSNDIQRKLLGEIVRTSADGAVVLHRSVETDSMPERQGLGRHFVPMAEASELATKLDRTRQFRRVSFYQVAH
jgi:S-adenosylmethionine-diacylglycerol 3-amino-3-carboxypropyl transferase